MSPRGRQLRSPACESRSGVTKRARGVITAQFTPRPMDRRPAAVLRRYARDDRQHGGGETAQWTDPSDPTSPTLFDLLSPRSGRANLATNRARAARERARSPRRVDLGPASPARRRDGPTAARHGASPAGRRRSPLATNARRPRVGGRHRPRPHRLHRLLDLRTRDEPALVAGAGSPTPTQARAPSRRSPQPRSRARPRSRLPSPRRPARRSSWPSVTGRR